MWTTTVRDVCVTYFACVQTDDGKQYLVGVILRGMGGVRRYSPSIAFFFPPAFDRVNDVGNRQ